MHLPAACASTVNPYDLISQNRWDDVASWISEVGNEGSADAQRCEAIAAWKAGRKDMSSRILSALVRQDPNDALSLRLLGELCLEEKAYEDARVILQHLDSLSECDAEARLGIAEAYLGLDNVPAARLLLWLILATDPTHSGALCMLAGIGVAEKNYDASIEALMFAHENNPDAVLPLSMLADTLESVGRIAQALPVRQKLVSLHPDNPLYLRTLARVQLNLSLLIDSLFTIEKSLTIDSEDPESHLLLGHIYMRLGRHKLAEVHFRQAERLRPADSGYAVLGCSLSLCGQDRAPEALDRLLSALDKNPNSYPLLTGLSLIQESYGEHEAAKSTYDRIVEHYPKSATARFNRSLIDLRLGNFDTGWADYESRFPSGAVPFPSIGSPKWDGSESDGHLLVFWEQGFGDSLQFSRFLVDARKRVGRVTFVCQPGLGDLMRRSGLADEVVEKNLEATDLPDHDFHIALMSLPFVLGMTSCIPATDEPYLAADPRKIQAWGERMGQSDRLKVGLIWSGKVTNPNNIRRMCPLAKLAGLSNVPGVQLFSFLKGPDVSQLDDVRGIVDIPDYGSQFSSFDDTAAALKNLDVLVSTCTSVPHLAGGLGVRTFIMLPFVADWRWLTTGTTTPWYPSVSLFRQSEPKVWDDVIVRVAHELERLAVARA